jgi:hypothetical protein
VVLQDAVRDSPKYFKLAGIVNLSILVSIACAWFGVCISAIVQTWVFLRHVRKRASAASGIASVGVR